MTAQADAVPVLSRLIAQGLASASECVDVLCATGDASRGVASRNLMAAAAAAALARERAAQVARRLAWPLVETGASRGELLAALRVAADGLLLDAECEAIARALVSARLRRRSARHGR